MFGDEKLQEAFGYLVGKMLYKEALPKDFITAEEFASDLLGFEEYKEGDDDEDEGVIPHTPQTEMSKTMTKAMK